MRLFKRILFDMSQQIRNKNAEIRNSIRRKQLEDYFRSRRTQIIEQQSGSSQQGFNQLIRDHISKNETKEIYDILFKKDSLKNLNKLSNLTCIDIKRFLTQNLANLQCVLLLRFLIDVRYKTIFLNREEEKANTELVYLIFDKIQEKVYEISNCKDEGYKKNCMKLINASLDCLRFFIFNKQQTQNGFSFNLVLRPQMIQRLWAHLKLLYMSPIYLMILAFAEIEFEMSTFPQFQQFIRSNVELILAITSQINYKDQSGKAAALPSVVLMNFIIKNMQKDKQFVLHVLPTYMQQCKFVHENSQDNAGKVFGNVHFEDMLENIVSIFQMASSEILGRSLGQVMSETNFWTFAFLLLRIQINNIRLQIYQIVKASIRNMLINKTLLQEYITDTLISIIVEGIESMHQQIVMQALETLQYLLYSASHHECKLFQLLNQYEISISLENLQYSPNAEIKKMTISIMHTLQKIASNDSEMICQE